MLSAIVVFVTTYALVLPAITFDEREQLSKDMNLIVDEIPEGSDSYNEYLQKTADEMWLISTDSIADARFFDIKIEKNGEKYEPEYPAKVTIKYENADRQ